MSTVRALLDRLADRGLTRDNAAQDVLAYCAMIATVADLTPLPGLRVDVTDRAALLDFLAQAVEVGTLEAAVST